MTLHVAGDVVTVTDPDVGQGWCQATSSDGTVGVVPEVITMWMFGGFLGGGSVGGDYFGFGWDLILHWFILS